MEGLRVPNAVICTLSAVRDCGFASTEDEYVLAESDGEASFCPA
jgi:hypothetical protein